MFNIIDFTPLSYGTYELPGWAQALGWLMAIASLSLFPVYAVVLIVQTYNNSDYDGMSLFQARQSISCDTNSEPLVSFG